MVTPDIYTADIKGTVGYDLISDPTMDYKVQIFTLVVPFKVNIAF